MKIMYLIYRPDSHVGGHVFSLLTLARAVQSRTPVVVVSVGVRSAALDDGSIPYFNVDYRGWQMCRALRELSRLINIEQPHVLHSFDPQAHFFAHVAAWKHGKGLIHTKCGGPNPYRLYPRAEDLILFSEENATYFKSSKRFRKTRIHLIANRVSEVPQNAEKIAILRSAVVGRHLTVLRIGRVSKDYENTSWQGLQLVRRLQMSGVCCRYVQIGNVQHEASLRRLESEMGEFDRIYTEQRFTLNASECIEAGDLVLGTGRSLMEAASRGRLLLVPVRDAELPVLVTPDNWAALAETNFSGRGSLPVHMQQDPVKALRQILTNGALKRKLTDFSRTMFQEHFSLDRKLGQYIDIYRSLTRVTRPAIFDLIVQGVRAYRKSTSIDTAGARKAR